MSTRSYRMTREELDDRELVWKHAERDMLRRERHRLIRLRRIVPSYRMKPQLMVRNPDAKGGWSPQIVGVN